MKTLLFNTSDKGGAAKSCIRLHHGLLQEKIESKLILKQQSDKSIAESFLISHLALKKSFGTKLKGKPIEWMTNLNLLEDKQIKFIDNRPKGLEFFSYPQSPYDLTLAQYYKEADVINLHWVSNFLDYPSFFQKNTKPVVWTLHDQNPFLGGEHYAERFLSQDEVGQPITRIYSKSELEEEKKLIEIKRKALENVKNLHIVAPSKWLVESSQSSELFQKFPHYHIPYGYPTDVFKPNNMMFCREVLGIPKYKKVILFVAESVTNSRKGFRYLQLALEKLLRTCKDEFVLCAIGNSSSLPNQDYLVKLGTISDERIMAVAYSAADVFVIPSLEDNLPNTMIESLLCGTPVIGFNTGGIPDAVVNYQTGLLCSNISVDALSTTIEKFFNESANFDRVKIAKEAKEKYALDFQAEAYKKLFESIV
ncbi:MAG: glycosyl transferase group 1 [Bacteroidota bacterium]|jgi:glycosyltransferase involved in cell wall biosynthesis|nr:glycosyl transferase group 1 [Bacteroidota bacterium]